MDEIAEQPAVTATPASETQAEDADKLERGFENSTVTISGPRGRK